MPYDRKALYRAVPPNSIYISEHAELSERWQDLSENPIIAALLEQGMDVSPEALEKLRNEPMAAKLFDKFANRNTLVSYTKILPGSGRPALVVASWAGSSGQVARWGEASGLLGAVLQKSGGGKLREIDFYKGRKAWTWERPGETSGYRVSAGFAEGVLVCCLSPDPEAVCHVLRRILEHDSMGSILRKHFGNKVEDDYYDRGWVRVSGSPNVISFTINSDDSSRVDGVIRISSEDLGFSVDKMVKLKEPLQDSGLNSIIGNVPGVFCALPFYGIKSMIPGDAMSISSEISKMTAQDALVFSALLGGDFSGHLMVRVPTLVVGVQVKKNTSLPGSDVVSKLLDEFNKEAKTAFIPVYEEYNGKQLLVIGGTADDFYGSLKDKDKSAVAVIGNWLIYSSNRDVMKKLLDGEAGSQDSSRWLESAPVEDFAGYGWMDLSSVDSAIESGIVAYSLMLSLDGGSGSKSTRRVLDSVRAGLRRVASLKSCKVMFKQHDSTAEIKFVLGE